MNERMPCTDADVSAFATFGKILRVRAAQTPDKIGFRFIADDPGTTQSLTYGQLERESYGIAAALRERQLEGERVALLYAPGLEFIAALFGCLCAGAVAVPTYPPRRSGQSRAANRLRSIVQDVRPAIVLTTSRLRSTVDATLQDERLTCLCTDQLREEPDPPHPPALNSVDDLALLQYTSGSTGAPKGVMLTHRNLIENSFSIARAFGHDCESRGVIWLPPYHDMGLVGGILQPLFAGFPVTLMAPATFLAKPIRWLTAISEFGATTSGGPNFAYDLCFRAISEDQKKSLDLSSWKVAFNGAEPISAQTMNRFSEAFERCGFRPDAFFPCYGLAEATLLVAGRHGLRAEHGPQRPTEIVSCGQGIAATVRIVDPQSCRVLGEGETGEVWIKGGSVAAGYWDREAESQKTFGAITARGDGPFLRTGDLGFIKHGELFLSGRLKDLIIIRGMKHHPHDIERSAQASHWALTLGGCAAFSAGEEAAETLVIAAEVERSRRDCDPAPVISAIRQAVARDHEIEPDQILLLRPGQLPRTNSGKLQRHLCRDHLLNDSWECISRWSAQQRDANPIANATPASPAVTAQDFENWVIGRLAQAVGASCADIEPTEPFARYGLDSVKAISLAAQIADVLGREVPAMLFWDYPSVRALSQHLIEGR